MSGVERSVVLPSVFVIGSALTYLLFFQECTTPPHVQVRHTTSLSFTRPSPALVLQATEFNTGARRPGYEASIALSGVALSGVALSGVALRGIALRGIALRGCSPEGEGWYTPYCIWLPCCTYCMS